MKTSMSRTLPFFWLPTANARKQNDKCDNDKQQQPSSELYDLILDMSWHKAVRHCRAHPTDASYQDGDNLETPLYLACLSRPPVRLVRSLLQAFPAGAETTSRNGDLPIHVACRYNASIEVLRALVNDHVGTVGISSKWGATAVRALWDGRDTIESNRAEENYETVFWKKMHCLLRALATSRQQSQGQSTEILYMVHAVVAMGSLGYPSEVLEYVLQTYPEQVSQKDGMGQLPLHIAVGPSQWSNRSRRKYKPREQQAIIKLLRRYAESAQCLDPNEPVGRYPLHTALANRHHWGGGIKELFQNAPFAASLVDPVTGVYPFQLAAVPVRDTAIDLDSVYQLLRVHPCAVADACCGPVLATIKRTTSENYDTESDTEALSVGDSDASDRSDISVGNKRLCAGALAVFGGGLVAYSLRHRQSIFTKQSSD